MYKEQLSSCSVIERIVSTAATVLLAYTIHSITAINNTIHTYNAVNAYTIIQIQAAKISISVLKIAASHWPFSDQFQHLTNQNFDWPNLLYIFNGTPINNLQKSPIFKNG